jgi:two-component system alkaline phosphatase synthesis response regulator PhoP
MGVKILLVDDEPDILEFLSFNLQNEGYEVEVASNGEDGIVAANNFRPDLIIVDIMMPKMDGVEFCRVLRQRSEFNNTIIAFLTAREEDYSQIAALEVGGDDYITKPIKPRVLKSRVQALLRRVKRMPETAKAVMRFDNLEIDTEGMTITKAGKIIELPKKEFELVLLLASKPGKVFTRDDIYSKIWGNDVIVGERTMDVHIRKIREKLGNEIIKTVKGVGYRFDF